MDTVRGADARFREEREGRRLRGVNPTRYKIKVIMVWGSFLIAAAALQTPTRNGNNAQGVNLTFLVL